MNPNISKKISCIFDALSSGQILSVSHHAVHRWEVVEGLNVADLRSVAETWSFRDDAFYPSTISIMYILYNLYNLYNLYQYITYKTCKYIHVLDI